MGGLEAKLKAAGRTVARLPVDNTAASTNFLDPRNRDFSWRVQEYRASVDLGATVLYAAMDLRAKKCRDEKFVADKVADLLDHRLGPQGDRGAHLLAEFGMRDADDGGLGDRGVLVEHLLDLSGGTRCSRRG